MKVHIAWPLVLACMTVLLVRWSVAEEVKSTADALAKGNSSLDDDNFDKAIANFAEAIRIDPKSAKAYSGRGCAYANRGDFNEAIADYTEAIRMIRRPRRRIAAEVMPTPRRVISIRQSPISKKHYGSTRGPHRHTTAEAMPTRTRAILTTPSATTQRRANRTRSSSWHFMAGASPMR